MPFSTFILPSLRIPAEEVRAGYLRRGWTPERARVNLDRCGLAALLGESWVENLWLDYGDAEEPRHLYAYGFTDGFDGDPAARRQPAYRAGYADGLAAWEAVKDLAEG